jgi:signal transduction histidine kinase
MLEAFSLGNPHFHSPVLVRPDGALWGEAGSLEPTFRALLASGAARSGVGPPPDGGVGNSMTIAQPVLVAGSPHGTAVATLDLVGVWPPVNAVKIGNTGFVRLLSGDGQLLAHGNPEERRGVFDPDPATDQALIAAARARRLATNQQGQEVIASIAEVPGTEWVVIVEQSSAEAFAPARAMRRDLFIFAGIVVVLVIGLGFALGRTIVTGLERLRTHTKVLARGELDKRAGTQSRLVEVRALAEALDEMAASLDALQREARARERLTTFARIAAGLAHDLRLPIEAVRGACDAVLKHPDDEGARDLLAGVHRRDLPRLREFVDDLRLLSQRGSMDLELDSIETQVLLSDVAQHLGTFTKWEGVEFESDGESPALLANRKLLRRALFNLGANAADACLEKGPGGRVVFAVSAVGDSVRFDVTDSGVGISSERVPELLTGDFLSTKRSSGIGLGLGVARQVAEVHGGTLHIDSEVGVGTTFALHIPANVGPVASDGARE